MTHHTFLPRALRGLWTAAALTALGAIVGLPALLLSAVSHTQLPHTDFLEAYLGSPALLFYNLLPPVVLIWLGYFAFRRAWAGFLCAFVPVVGLAAVNFFKIRLRSDPLLAVDLRLAAEAGNISGGYELEMHPALWAAAGVFCAGLVFARLCIPKSPARGWERLLAAVSCVCLALVCMAGIYFDSGVYRRVQTRVEGCSDWSELDQYLLRGGTYSFLHSFQNWFPSPPEGYDPDVAAGVLSLYPDADIPEGEKISVMAIMLEAFCDLTDVPALAGQEGVQQVYASWHALEERSVHGDLLTNIFAGGTVDTEWGFLTGYSRHGDFRSTTDSFVHYLRDQGYQTFGSHPGYGWFYNRQNVNRYLGFEEYWFTENHYGQFIDPISAMYGSDRLLCTQLLEQLGRRMGDGPCFSFSVSYQNHGPYEWTYTAKQAYLTPETSGLTEEACHVFNNYLSGLSDTISAVTDLAGEVEELERPVVLVLFGDHMPWAGNGNSAYTAAGVHFDLSTSEGFYEYYAVPYLIFANAAARAVIGTECTGAGGDISPCFLMSKVFDLCGWEGPGFMQLQRQVQQITPLLHESGRVLYNDRLTDALPPGQQDFLTAYLWAQYARETALRPE